MSAHAYYNEIDPFAAAWLRELIKDNLIAPGFVDERSIEDVTPYDLQDFTQCHFFAGIGVWSLAARQSGIPDDAPLWSGSCPCQPFSAAGKGAGFADERHLWPAFHYLIEQRRPGLVVGEQVAGRNGDVWLDLVRSDLEATGYAFGAVETVAGGFGAPHKRSRNYWVAKSLDDAPAPRHEHARGGQPEQPEGGQCMSGLGREPGGLAHDACGGRGEEREDAGGLAVRDSAEGRTPGLVHGSVFERLENADAGLGEQPARSGSGPDEANGGRSLDQPSGRGHIDGDRGPCPTNGYWADADWLLCRDERWRAVERGTFPLADAGTFRNRVGLLRGAGNAITLGQAEGFLRAVIKSAGLYY